MPFCSSLTIRGFSIIIRPDFVHVLARWTDRPHRRSGTCPRTRRERLRAVQQLEGYFETLLDPKESLQTWRQKAWSRFLELGWPRPKQEAFQYLPLKDLHIPQPALPPQTAGHAAAPYSLLFTDGFFQHADLPQPLICLKLDAAMLVYGVFLQNRISRSLKEETDPIAAMNGAFQGKGAFLYIPPDTCIEQPIEIHHHATTRQMASPAFKFFSEKGHRLGSSSEPRARKTFLSAISISMRVWMQELLFSSAIRKNGRPLPPASNLSAAR